jgi:hypothetical protein
MTTKYGVVLVCLILAATVIAPPVLAQAGKPVTEVAVVNQPRVEVNSSPAAPLYVREVESSKEAELFYALRKGAHSQGCGTNFCRFVLDQVPAGKRLIITNFHGVLAFQAGSEPLAVALENSYGTVFEVPRDNLTCFTDKMIGGWPDRCPFNQSLKVVFEAGDTPVIDFNTTPAGALSHTRSLLVVAGYYQDVPAAAATMTQAQPQPSVPLGTRRVQTQ